MGALFSSVTPHRDSAVVYIAIMTGMRKGEILALQWKDIDFENDLIEVTKSVYHEGDQPLIKEPKTEAGNRIAPPASTLKGKAFGRSSKEPRTFHYK